MPLDGPAPPSLTYRENHAIILLVDGSALVSMLWPQGLPQFVRGDYTLSSVHNTSLLVPCHEDGLRAWCYVAEDHNACIPNQNKFLASTTSNVKEPEGISIRFQGFVRDAQLGTFGTWSGYVRVTCGEK